MKNIRLFIAAPFVIIISILVKKVLSHGGGNAVLTAFEEYLNIVAHEGPGADGVLSLSDVFAQQLQKPDPALVVVEYVGFVDPPDHDVVQRAGDIPSCLSRHGAIP
jgi:hypothetical protein